MSRDGSVPNSNTLDILEEVAQKEPDRPFAKILGRNWRSDGARTVTYAQVVRASNRLSWWLDENLGPSKKNFETVAYLGVSDIRYAFMMFAAIKTQRKVIIPDRKLAGRGLVDVLEKVECQHWVGSEDTIEETKQRLSDQKHMAFYTLPSVEHWLDESSVPNYPYDRSWEKAMLDPVLIIHSSGTTGNPKPLIWSHAMMGVWNVNEQLPDGTMNNENLQVNCLSHSTYLSTAPAQWLGGTYSLILAVLYAGAIPIMPPPEEANPLASAALVNEILAKFEPDGLLTMPSILHDLCLDDTGLARARKLNWVSWAGAPLDRWTGDLLYEHVTMIPALGATDGGWYPTETSPDKNHNEWDYYKFSWRLGACMEPIGEQDFHELVIRRDPALRRYQAVFFLRPELTEWRTNDLYAPHPTKPDLWRYVRRADDLFKLAWLTKVMAEDVESALERHAAVSRALVGGDARPTPFIIVEPKQALLERNVPEVELKEEIWRAVEEVNASMAAEVKIPKTNIIVVDPKRPLQRLTKGTLNRRGILAAYEQDINQLYMLN